MKTEIKVSISGGKVEAIEVTEKDSVADKEAKKKAALAFLDAMFKPLIKGVGK